MLRALALVIVVALLSAPCSLALAQDESEMREGAEGLAAPRPSTRIVAALPASAVGLDPVVAPYVTERVRAVLGTLGYELASDPALGAALARLRVPLAETPADLWRVAYLTEARRSVAVRLSAARGLYIYELLIASLDGTGPFRAQGEASAQTLLDELERALRAVMPPASVWDEEAAARIEASTRTVSAAQLAPSPFVPRHAIRRPYTFVPPTQEPLANGRFGLTLQTEAAMGVGGRSFRNHVLGVRFAFHVSRTFALAAYVGYVNLESAGARAHNLLFYAQIEHRIAIYNLPRLSIPLRVAAGYLPYNGVFVRGSAGIAIALSERFELGIDVLGPAVWFTPNGRYGSYDLALDLTYRFGARRVSNQARRESPP